VAQKSFIKNLKTMSLVYSLVIPVKDEEENLEDLILEIQEVMTKTHKPWEIIFVDDGSKDQSLSILQRLSTKHPQMVILSFDKNYGQSSAFSAGFKQARGEFVITMDADRQNDPKDILPLIEAVSDADLVVGWRFHRKDSIQKRIISKVSNKVRSALLKDHMHDSACSLKIFRKKALDRLKMYDGMHRFFPALFLIEGFLIKEVIVSHRPRLKGQTKYHFFNRSIRPFLDLFAVFWMRKRHLKYKIK
jgi:dolichol-phosphate mannosyltransferase